MRRGIQAASLAHRLARHVTGRRGAAASVARGRAAFYDAVWRGAAEAAGARVEDLRSGCLRIYTGDSTLLVRDNVTSLDDPVTLAIAGDKPLVLRLLSDAGIPVPAHVVARYDDLPGAWAFVRRVAAPCVVKPALDGAAGAGVTTGVDDRRRLAAAMARAGAWSGSVLVERQVEGEVYRLLFLDGVLLDAVLRRPPVLRGDGRSTIRRLIADENADRAARGAEAAQSLLRHDADLVTTLRRQGYSLSSVPPAGVAVQAKSVVNDNRKSENEAAAGRLCAEVAAIGARAAREIGVRLAGVDIITTDPGVPLEDSGGVVLEVNTTPGYYYHYHRSGQEAPVASMILERLGESRP
jgi:cyanophycin synthetase